MSNPLTAAEVQEATWVRHDKQLCHVVSKKHDGGTGPVFIQWEEGETLFSGSFRPGAYFGEQAIIL